MPVQTNLAAANLKVTLTVKDGTGGIGQSFPANVTINWDPSKLALGTVESPVPSYSTAGSVVWIQHPIPFGASGRNFVVNFLCNQSGNHQVTGTAYRIDDDTSDSDADSVGCP